MKKYLILTGVILVIALVFYLEVKSEKTIETILSSGGIVGILALIFNRKRTGSGNKGRGSGEQPGIDIDELERIRQRYRAASDRVDKGLRGAKSEAGRIRAGLERDRERINGLEGSAVRVRDIANKLDELIERIQTEGID